jgi:hypothetical protein
MKLLNLPGSVINQIMMFDSHPCADTIKQLCNKIMTNSYYGIDEYIFRKKKNEFSESFVENWFEWHSMNQGELEERETFIKKYELSDSDDEDF